MRFITLVLSLVGSLLICGCNRHVRVDQGETPRDPSPSTVSGTTRPDAVAAPPPLTWATVGYSAERRAIEATTIGTGAQRVLILGGIHGDEAEGLALLPSVMELLRRDARLHTHWTARVIRDMNPDGSARGTRSNARGVDLNRNWPAQNFRASRRHGDAPMSESETRAVLPIMESFRPDVIIVFHSTARGPFVNYDGPAHDLAARWVNAANDVDPGAWRVVESMGYPTPGSLGSYAGVDRRIPILTIEFRRGAALESFRDAAMAGMRAVLGG